jgi:hypothetical protein
MRRCSSILLLCLLPAGCFRVEVYAPEGPPVRLLARDEKTDVLRVRRTWYAVLGAVAMEKYMPNEIIALERFEEVRVRVTDTIPDALYGLFNTVVLQVGILAQTYEVLGNRAAAPAPAPPNAATSPAPAPPAGPN